MKNLWTRVKHFLGFTEAATPSKPVIDDRPACDHHDGCPHDTAVASIPKRQLPPAPRVLGDMIAAETARWDTKPAAEKPAEKPAEADRPRRNRRAKKSIPAVAKAPEAKPAPKKPETKPADPAPKKPESKRPRQKKTPDGK